MSVQLRRQLDDDEKAAIIKMHGRRDFATGLPIPDDDEVQFDHIHAYAEGGETGLNNIAPMSAETNRAKSTLSLADYRVKRRMDEFFQAGDRLTLGHLLRFLKECGDVKSFGQVIEGVENDGLIQLRSAAGVNTHRLYKCPATGWKYFYATVPVHLIDSDDDSDQIMGLQPRYLLPYKVFDLYRHFQLHPVLQPSIGRVVGNRLKMFDGQHKIAALLWVGRREFEVKIYLTCDVSLLNRTNMAAHDKYSQTRFATGVMMEKLGKQFGKDFEEYTKDENEAVKSEAGFLEWLARHDPGMGKADRSKRFRSYLYNSVIDNKENKASKFISAGNRSTNEKPLTIDMLSKSIFACFMYRVPLQDDMGRTDVYRRQIEIENVVALMNMLHDLGLHAWKADAPTGDTMQRKLNRMFRSKSIMAWSELLANAIAAKLDLVDSDDQARPFYRELSKQQLEQVKAVVSRLVGWKFWADANDDIDRQLSDNKRTVKQWFKDHGLTPGYLMGASI
jgi:hypothetical protein